MRKCGVSQRETRTAKKNKFGGNWGCNGKLRHGRVEHNGGSGLASWLWGGGECSCCQANNTWQTSLFANMCLLGVESLDFN